MDQTPLAPYVAAEIRAEMARRNISSAALALRVGRPKQTVHRWTAGQTAISLDDIPVICTAIGTSMGELLAAAISHRERDSAAAAAALITSAQSRPLARLAS